MSLEAYARWHYRFRWWIAAAVLLTSIFLLPYVKGFEIENDLAAWFEHDDPYWVTYREYRKEFGGTRTLIVAIESQELFTRPVLLYLRRLSEDLERLPHVLRVYSLATANRVTGTHDSLEVRPLLENIEGREPLEIRDRVLSDSTLRGDLVSADGTVAAITVSFDEEKLDPVREQVLTQARRLAEIKRPPSVRLHYNGSVEISEEYNRQSMANVRNYTPLMFLLITVSIYFLFRSWSRVLIVILATLLSLGWTLAIFGLLGFTYNIVSTMIVPLIAILAIADDMHLLQRFDLLAEGGSDRRIAFQNTVSQQLVPIFGASLTTSLGMASLATSRVAAVREFGIVAAVGVMIDFLISFSLLPLALTVLPARGKSAPAGRPLGQLLARFSSFMASRTRPVIVLTAGIMVAAVAGIFHLRVSTNHIEFFPEENPLHRSALLIDEKLAGIYSFEVILEGEPETFKDPAMLRRVESFCLEVEQIPHIKRAVSFLDSLKQVHQELSGGGEESYRIPASREAVAQEIFLFSLSEAGRSNLSTLLTSDFSRVRVWVKMRSTASEEVFQQILKVEDLADKIFSETTVRAVVTGSGRLFAALDAYLVQSQLSSFATAFLTVFGVIFLVFRSIRYGLLAIIPNLVPVVIVLGLMGWLGITLNIATVMVASIALGVIDDDTVHFIVHFRREMASGSGIEPSLSAAIVHAGGAALLSALVNSVAFGITATSEYKPTFYWGFLMSLTMLLAFISEVILLPACIRVGRRFLASPTGEKAVGSFPNQSKP